MSLIEIMDMLDDYELCKVVSERREALSLAIEVDIDDL